uniref:Uncharacterized protein n=1 Tax=Anguilla anguilla TaxID=7936 RepID=A0A0E9XWF3_ANGAN
MYPNLTCFGSLSFCNPIPFHNRKQTFINNLFTQ